MPGYPLVVDIDEVNLRAAETGWGAARCGSIIGGAYRQFIVGLGAAIYGHSFLRLDGSSGCSTQITDLRARIER